jgi:hypothetical protein
MDGNRLFAAILGASLSGCAVLPDATITYYLPTSDTTVNVTQTIACDKAKNPNVTVTLSVKASYRADYSPAGEQRIAIKSLDGSFSDTDVDFTLTEDGRLKGINSSQTGQGQTIIKDVVTVAVAAAAIAGTGVEPPKNWCAQPGSDKPVTIAYNAGSVPLKFEGVVLSSRRKLTLQYDTSSATAFDTVSPYFPDDKLSPTVYIEVAQAIKPVSEGGTPDGVPVTFPRMHKVTFNAYWGLDDQAKPMLVATQDIFIPDEKPGAERTFVLHIPPSAMFGTQKFVVGLSDSGAITDIHYAKGSGAAGALEAGQSVVNPLKPESTADKASELKAQADLIYQQQRLAACRASTSIENCK